MTKITIQITIPTMILITTRTTVQIQTKMITLDVAATGAMATEEEHASDVVSD